ncbi:hypothetical protein [Paraburkholderia caledonica]|uniref:Inovirus Gp2 family protein n=1 Tax=Paraburkholderia caledonica TaxID=134536 RepID=A0ABU1KT88_9BURK|nr:hypothetical protein [Paraburkholderia caledonica]MDR6374172.1 hypothetical protein [Paraburkholderia caledonica]
MNINPFRKTDSGLKLRLAHIEWLKSLKYTHFLTLNFHAAYTEQVAQKRLRKWNLDVRSRLFRSKRFENCSRDELFSFTAFPEHAPSSGHLHYHALAYVNEERRDWFVKCAPTLWKQIVPTGTCDLRVVPSKSDVSGVAHYITKLTERPFSYNSFIVSRMLDTASS